MSRRDPIPPVLAPLGALAWLRYVGSLLSPLRDSVTRGLARAGRAAAWWCAVALLTLTSKVVRQTASASSPGDSEPTPEPTMVVTAAGIRVRDKRKVRPEPAASPPPVLAPSPTAPSAYAMLRSWWALLGWLLLKSKRRSVPPCLDAADLGRQVSTDPVRRLVVLDRHAVGVDVEAFLALAADEQAGDWRVPVAFWLRDHLPAAARVSLVTRELAASAQPPGRLSVVLRVAAATADALPDADARAILGTAMALARRDIDPYAYSGDVILARTLAVRLLVERPELDDLLLTTIGLQAGLASTPDAGPIELRLLALAVRERAPDAGAALAAAAVAAEVAPEDLEVQARRADRPLRRPARMRRLRRPGAPLARLWRAVTFVIPWLWPVLATGAVATAADRLGWTVVPRNVGVEETIAALALVATVNVFTVQLSAQRLPGVVARYAAQPASLHASYSAALMALVLAVAPETPEPFAAARSWAPVVALGVFVVTFLFALLRFQQQSDSARAAAAHVRTILPRARAAGRRMGRYQARAAAMKDALEAAPGVTLNVDEVHGEWRTLLLARRRGLLVPRRRDLRVLLSSAPFFAGMRLRLFVGLGRLVRDGAHLGALVPAANQAVDRRTVRRAHRRLRIMSADDIEDVQRATIALVELGLRLVDEGDVGTAERVCRSVVRLVDEHTAAARGVRRAGYRREVARAGVTAAGLRGDALEARAARRLDDDQLAPVIPALQSALLLGARAQLQPEQHGFDVVANLLAPLLDATTEADGALAYLPVAVPRSQRADARAHGLAELLRAVGVRAAEIGAATPFELVLNELDQLAAQSRGAAIAVRTTSALGATAARMDAQLAVRALSRVVQQASRASQPDVVRRRGLWRVGAAALAAGTLSVAVRAARLVEEHGDTTALRADAEQSDLLTEEAFTASINGSYLGDSDLDALANFGRFLGTLAPLLSATTAT